MRLKRGLGPEDEYIPLLGLLYFAANYHVEVEGPNKIRRVSVDVPEDVDLSRLEVVSDGVFLSVVDAHTGEVLWSGLARPVAVEGPKGPRDVIPDSSPGS